MSSGQRELASSFVPGDIEGPLYKKWIDAGYFTADANSSKEPFTIFRVYKIFFNELIILVSLKFFVMIGLVSRLFFLQIKENKK